MVDEQEHGHAGMEAADELLTLTEALSLLNISRPTMYRLLDAGAVKGLKAGTQWRFRRADLMAYLQRGPAATASASVPEDVLDAELAFFAAQVGTPVPAVSEESELAPGEQKGAHLASLIIKLAIAQRASDIHLEPTRMESDTQGVLRLRIDGVLHEVRHMPQNVYGVLLARLKTMAEMNVEERRLPQDGRMHALCDGKPFDLRVNTVPSVYGESMVLRLLPQSDVMLGLEKMGLLPEMLAQLRQLMHRPNGLVLFTGPTGSGKTTVLYSCLLEVIQPGLKVLTAEDPVEYVLPGTLQCQVNRRAGLTFAALLRAFLRHDPDVIMCGEIRDLETASILTQSALTGHLALSQMTIDSAVAALVRLEEMGLEPYLIASAMSGVLCQRLVRRLCDACKVPVDIPEETLQGLELPEALWRGGTFYRAVGCPACRAFGYRGRIGIYELLVMDHHLSQLVARHAPEAELTRVAVETGMTTLLMDGVQKAMQGQTTLEEVLRVLGAR